MTKKIAAIYKKPENFTGIQYYADNLFSQYQHKLLSMKRPFVYRFLYYLPWLTPKIDWFFKKDLFIFPEFIAWPTSKAKTISVVHDLSYMHFPESVKEKNRKFLAKLLPDSIERSTHIVVNSHYTKKDVVDHFPSAKNKVSVVTPGLNHEKFKPASRKSTNKVRKKYNLPENYILFVGTLEPRKNLETLVDAYSLLPKKLQESHKVVVAGGKGWNDQKLLAKLESNENILQTGYVADENLPGLYSGAEVFVFPSLFEGFGMPILEAQACGTPVVAANNSSLPEAAGPNGALFFETKNAKELADNIKKVLTDKTISEKLVKEGFKNARKYSWEDSSQKIQEVIKKVL